MRVIRIHGLYCDATSRNHPFDLPDVSSSEKNCNFLNRILTSCRHPGEGRDLGRPRDWLWRQASDNILQDPGSSPGWRVVFQGPGSSPG